MQFTVFSGQPYAQKFRRADDPQAIPKSNEPIPEGYYDGDQVEWANGQENTWSGSFGAGVGNAWASIIPRQAMKRGAFGFHLDDNKDYAPGSAGCIVFWTPEEYMEWAAWRKKQPGLVELIVQWGLGLVQEDSKPLATFSQKIFLNNNRCRAFSDGKEVTELSLFGARLSDSGGHFQVDRRDVYDVVSAELVVVRRRP